MQEARGIILACAKFILAVANTTEVHKGVSLYTAHTLPDTAGGQTAVFINTRDYGG